MIVRAFPKHAESYLMDRVNHRIATERLTDVDRYKGHWEVVEEDGTEWIQARLFDDKDELTQAGDKLREMAKSTERYPLLDEYEYCDSEYQCIVSALCARAKQLGTVINSPRTVIAALFDAGIEIVEGEPMKFMVMIGDEELLQIIKEADQGLSVINPKEERVD